MRAFTQGDIITFSMFFKAGEFDQVILGGYFQSESAKFNLKDGSVVSQASNVIDAYSIPFENDWYRCVVTYTFQNAINNGYLYSGFKIVAISDGVSSVGDGAKGLFAYGAQFEEATYPTSYIPTYGTSQTRLKDVCVDAGNASTFNDSEGVLYIEIATLANDGARWITLSDGGNSNSVYIGYNTNGRLDVNLRSGGVYQAAFNYTGVANPSEINKIAFKYKQNDFALWVNGVEVGTDSSGITPIGLDKLNFSTTNAVADFFFGNVKQVLYFPTALSDQACIELTTL